MVTVTSRAEMSAQESFTGMAMIHVIEATGLKPVTLPGGKVLTVMDPYCVIDFDDIYFGRTNNKKATTCPVWGETLEESIEDAQRMQITLFHSSLIPPDNFIAHSQISVAELLQLTQGGHEEHEVFINQADERADYRVCQQLYVNGVG